MNFDEKQSVETQVSERWNDLTADVTFRSSDNILFKVHRRNLEFFSEGFAAEGLVSSRNEVIPLEETSDVLDLLFQYMYNRPQPDLAQVQFDVLAGLAEAAEKYEVHSAITICKLYMQRAIRNPRHVIRVLEYSIKHGHTEMMDMAGKASLQRDFSSVFIETSMSPYTFIAWVRYRELWLGVQRVALLEITHTHNTNSHSPCFQWSNIYKSLAVNGLVAVKNPLKVVDDNSKGCEGCESELRRWGQRVEELAKTIPKFSTLVI